MNQSELQELNTKLHDLFTYRSDKKVYDVMEDWRSHASAVENGEGFTDDCDGFAFTACEILINNGVPRETVKFIVCNVDGGGHAVAGVDLDGVTWIFDCNSRKIYDWKNHPRNLYRKVEWNYFMKFDEPGQWYKVQ